MVHLALIATTDVALGGETIRAGQTLAPFYPSGNRDDAAFPDPYRVDVGREPNRHIVFGHGVHYCLGSHVGRSELRAKAMLPLLPRLELVGEPTATVICTSERSTTSWSGFAPDPGARRQRTRRWVPRAWPEAGEELRAVEVDDDLAERCVWLTAALGLSFSGIDLRRAPDGRAVCFEVNPCPAFSYYEAHTGQPIAAAVARLLASDRRANSAPVPASVSLPGRG